MSKRPKTAPLTAKGAAKKASIEPPAATLKMPTGAPAGMDKVPDKPEPERKKNTGNLDGDKLKKFIERVEKLEEDKRACAEDIKEVYGEAKKADLDVKTMRKVVQRRRMDAAARREQDQLLDLYETQIDIFS